MMHTREEQRVGDVDEGGAEIRHKDVIMREEA